MPMVFELGKLEYKKILDNQASPTFEAGRVEQAWNSQGTWPGLADVPGAWAGLALGGQVSQ